MQHDGGKGVGVLRLALSRSAPAGSLRKTEVGRSQKIRPESYEVSGPFLRGAGQKSFRGLVALCAGFRIKPASNNREKIAGENRGNAIKNLTFFCYRRQKASRERPNIALELGLLVVGDLLHVGEEPLRVARIKVVLRNFKRPFMGPAEGQDGRIGQRLHLLDNKSLIGRGNGVAQYHQVELSIFTRIDSGGEPYRRLNLKSLAAEHELSCLQ